MTQIHRTIVITFLMVSILLIFTNDATASPYAFSVDRFSAAGNISGNFIDEFDDGVIGSSWDIYEPTVVESNGMLTLSSPGGVEQIIKTGGMRLSSEMSYAAIENLAVNGLGDFQATSTWSPSIPDTDQLYNMNFKLSGTDGHINIMVYNFSQTVSDFIGVPQGLGILFGFFGDAEEGDVFAQGVSILPENITDNILLRLYFSDSSDLFTGDFSLDGGATFQSPFNPIASTEAVGGINLHLGAEQLKFTTVPLPAAGWLFISALAGFVGSRQLFKQSA